MKYTTLCAALCAAVSLFGCGGSAPKFETPAVTPAELKEHVRFLASDTMKGRKVGTPEDQQAARYIADRFKEFGVSPAGENGTYFQRFPFVAGAEPGPSNALSFSAGGRTLTMEMNRSFRTLAFSADTTIEAGLVFAGATGTCGLALLLLRMPWNRPRPARAAGPPAVCAAAPCAAPGQGEERR